MNFLKNQFPQPHPDLSPQDVVKIQLDALQNNDLFRDNRGIRAAFLFASPENQAMTGPVERFIEMVKNPLYAPMIGFERAELGLMVLLGSMAQQRVRLYQRGGTVATFVFTLSRQQTAPYEGCWMTDSVVPQAD
ncbi:MAG: hypothetical protein OHK0046_20430 [Anaerolineae bacterium]